MTAADEQPTSLPHLDLDDREEHPASAVFTLAGRDWYTRSREDVPFGVAAKLMRAMRSGDEGELVEQIGPFFQAVLMPGQYVAFQAVVDDPESPLTLESFQKLAQWVTEKVMGVPTAPPSGSALGRKATGSNSKAVSSSRGTRRRAS